MNKLCKYWNKLKNGRNIEKHVKTENTENHENEKQDENLTEDVRECVKTENDQSTHWT